jgi:hypothetical protein
LILPARSIGTASAVDMPPYAVNSIADLLWIPARNARAMW